MKRQLNILTRASDEVARKVLLQQQQDHAVETSVIDLTQPEVDYDTLVREIFAADTVHVW